MSTNDKAFVAKNGIVANGAVTINSTALYLGNTPISANGSFGSAGQALFFDGTKHYFGNITPSPAGADKQIQFNDSGSSNGSAGLTFNKTSNTIYVGNSTVNTSINSTSYNTGTTVINATAIAVGSNVVVNVTSIAVGNSTVSMVSNSSNIRVGDATSFINVSTTQLTVGSNVVVNTSALLVGNSTVNTSINSTSYNTGTTVINATAIAVGSNVVVNTSALLVGNSTVNTVITSTTITTNLLNVNTNVIVAVANGFVGVGNSAPADKLHVQGNLIVTGDITGSYSDERLKNIIGVVNNASEKIKKISGYYYYPSQLAFDLRVETENKIRIGVSAQETQKVFPELVSIAPFDRQKEDNYLTVSYEKFVPILIEVVKDLINRIEILEKK